LLYFYTARITWEDVTLFHQLGDHLSATYVCYLQYAGDFLEDGELWRQIVFDSWLGSVFKKHNSRQKNIG